MNQETISAKQIEEMSKKCEKFWKVINDCQFSSLDEKQRAFAEIGIAPSKKGAIYRENTLSLNYYPSPKKVHETPVFIVPALINKNYIMDLLPAFSMIEFLLNAGFNVYMIDWGTPGPEHGALTLDDYIDGLIRRCSNRIIRHSGENTFHLLGQCIGGILAALFAARYSSQGFIQSLSLLTTPVDFEYGGILKEWTNPKTFNLDKLTNSFIEQGAIPPEMLHSGFGFLDVNLTFNKYKNLFNFADNEAFVRLYRALDFWGNDNVPFPAEVFRKFIRDLYQKNLFIQDGIQIGEHTVKLSDVSVPVYNAIARDDHVFPVAAAQGWKKAGVKNYIEDIYEGGHVTIVAALPERFRLYQNLCSFLTQSE